MPVSTFEWTGTHLDLLSSSESLQAASRDLPEGVYTTFRTYGGRRVLRLSEHLARLEESAELRGMPGALDAARARRTLGAALDATSHPESRLRLTFCPPRLLVSVEPFTPLPPARDEEGAACVSAPIRRDNPRAKDTRFIATAQAAYASLPPGVEEALMLDETGAVLEGLSSNFFAVRDGRLWTEEARVLAGVTRKVVLELAMQVLPVERTAVALDPRVSECFITSVSREVLPVVRIDARPVGEGRPGPVTRTIAREFQALVAREAEPP
ncbi:MAG TPA: aminotransferase class IV [Vicinamibacteria bacterium]